MHILFLDKANSCPCIFMLSEDISCSLKILHALAVIKTSILQAKPVLAGIKYGMNCFVLLSDFSEHLGSFIRP